jgi:hypothetical protein
MAATDTVGAPAPAKRQAYSMNAGVGAEWPSGNPPACHHLSMAMPHRHPPPNDRSAEPDLAGRLGRTVLDALGDLPRSNRPASPHPDREGRRLMRLAGAKAALSAGALALPIGPIGWLTVLPELVAVWKIQARMVADIAAVHGHAAPLTQEEMLYCLFRHSSGQVVRDLVLQVGERSLVQTASVRALQMLAARLGASLARRLAGKGLARWLPVVGAAGLGAYAYWDTRQVAMTATELFSREVVVVPAAAPELLTDR